MENFTIIIHSSAMQVLESAYIIANSKNIDTIINRYELLMTRLLDLKEGSSNPKFNNSTQNILEEYKKLYYDRPIQEYQLSLLSDPNGFDINNFYCTSLVNAMKRFCEDQLIEINAMKQENAKKKRSSKAIEIIYKAKVELQDKCSTNSNYSTALHELDKYESIFNLLT